MSEKFQLNTKSIFLTYPQCDFPLNDFLLNIDIFFGENIEKCIASQELHMDGNKHLHAAICLKKPYRSRSADCLDHLALQHPNISGRFKGGWKKAFKYVMKDGNYLTLPREMNLTTLLSSGDKKTEKISTLLRSGASLDAIDDQEPAYMLMHLQQVQRYASFLELKKKRAEFAQGQLRKVLVEPAEHYSSDWNKEIASWLETNIRQKRSHRQKQLWIKAPPGAGKTSLIMWLEDTFNLSIYYWPRDEKWWDGYSDGCYDLIVLDEYRAQKMITELNPVLSGDRTPVSRRNLPAYVKKDNLPVIICSNFNPIEAYHKVHMSQLLPLLDRLDMIEVPDLGVIRIVEKLPVPLSPTVVFDDTPEDPPLSQSPPSFSTGGQSVFERSYHLHGKNHPTWISLGNFIQSQSDESFAAADARFAMLD